MEKEKVKMKLLISFLVSIVVCCVLVVGVYYAQYLTAQMVFVGMMGILGFAVVWFIVHGLMYAPKEIRKGLDCG